MLCGICGSGRDYKTTQNLQRHEKAAAHKRRVYAEFAAKKLREGPLRPLPFLKCFDLVALVILSLNEQSVTNKTKQQAYTLCTGCRACLIPASFWESISSFQFSYNLICAIVVPWYIFVEIRDDDVTCRNGRSRPTL